MDMKIMQPSFQYRLRFIKFLTYLSPCSSSTVSAVLLSSSCGRFPLVMYWTTQTHTTMQIYTLFLTSHSPFCDYIFLYGPATIRSVKLSACLASDSLDKELTELRAQVTELTLYLYFLSKILAYEPASTGRRPVEAGSHAKPSTADTTADCCGVLCGGGGGGLLWWKHFCK